MSTAPSDYPGERLGLPESGPRSIARLGRRIVALLIDLGAAALVGWAFFDYHPLATNLLFAATQILFIPTIGGSPGHRIMGLGVATMHGGWVGLWRPVARTALLFLVIPAVIWDSDQRGLHDRVAGTLLVRTR